MTFRCCEGILLSRIVGTRARPATPLVVIAIPGGTYHRRYWDLQPPGRTGYSQAEWGANRGVVFVACAYLGGGDSTRPDAGDFMTLEVCADAAHDVHRQVRRAATNGALVAGLPALTDPRFVGVGQSLGGFITMIQQGKYADYPGIAVLGASPLLIANIPFHRSLEGLSEQERREAVLEDNARSAGVDELPTYHGARGSCTAASSTCSMCRMTCSSMTSSNATRRSG